MRILALDTATEACTVALWLDGAVHVDSVELARGHAQRILPINAGLALGAALPAVGVSNLAAVAQAALDRDVAATHVLVCNDARMKEVYTGLYRRGGDGLAVLEGIEQVAPPAAVSLPATHDSDRRRVLGAGRGFGAYPQLAVRLRDGLASIDGTALPGAGEIARLAAAALRRGEGLSPEALQPVYLRDDVAIPAVTVLK